MSSIDATPILSINPDLVLTHAADRLTAEFDGTFDRETIERRLHSTYDELAARATVLNYLPLLTERFTREHLEALRHARRAAPGTRPVRVPA